ncbi:SH3 domain-containing protein [Pedobacter insulae]|uniref:SH3 domain-containing protein n=1 Tax=Pedobacter insulae TaxID=414048 RepID=A0A1I2U8D0_9SPHI|nr:SH3 domain-containing protein [Pedobacter insulae]SFG73380.1 SH3 domain-containing protein [Pedobacter insulae]
MNRYFFLLFTFVLFSFSVNAQDIYSVTADKLNVRETKDPSSKKIGFLPQGENVAVLDSSDTKFFKIKVTNGEGWVSKDYLRRISPVPIKKSAETVVTVTQNNEEGRGNIVFIILAIVVMVMLLFVIIKFVPNKVFMVFSAAMVLIIGYFFYLGFIVEKVVSGKYTTDTDAQYQSFDFKSKDSVVIHDTYLDSLSTAHYVIEGDVIKFKQQENTFLLLIRDDSTLVGEGFTKGIFKKN